ncbi:hypothetical protein ACQPYK_19815 [Streptosporangium sp. CA-135522]|uniref:hypothetical protein n=1 Tax=Streptosporangium sp. CA-135522 TaxID=3240072 RepID=UPI003D8F5C43
MRLDKILDSVGDRMLSRLVPQDTAAADDCTYEYKCDFSLLGCFRSAYRNKYTRLVCAGNSGPSYGDWERVGCC